MVKFAIQLCFYNELFEFKHNHMQAQTAFAFPVVQILLFFVVVVVFFLLT